ncbi:MAG: hypothetical protein AB8B53_06690 [Flavobacteriales bacterium]
MLHKTITLTICFVLILVSWAGLCTLDFESKGKVFEFEITNLTDEQYPDNPDIGYRASDYQNIFFQNGTLEQLDGAAFSFNLKLYSLYSDSIWLNKLDLSEFIPTIPENVKKDEYLSYISCINQEWNRNQVKFNPKEFSSTNSKIIRVDVARNCLNAYLWEVIIYVEENGATVPYAHGWFDFPDELYAQLFELKNRMPFSEFQAPLEHWQDPANEELNLNVFRTITSTIETTFSDLSDEMYPLEKARKKKFKEIIYPTSFNTMRDLQTDSSLFATFTPPGFYNRSDPRTTELGRFYALNSVEVKKVRCNEKTKPQHEVSLSFSHKDSQEVTQLIIGGLNFEEVPVLSPSQANSGWKNSMGIGNHTFYEDYTTHVSTKSEESPYYGVLLDDNGNWLDSHKVGIDGPIFHFSDKERKELHLWLLSFERHALVGHYVIQL